MKLNLLYRRRWLLIYLPLLLLVGALLAAALFVWQPLPPRHLVIGTEPGQSSYLALARAYAMRLERMGIAVDIVAHERLQMPPALMSNGGTDIDVTFAQGLHADGQGQLQALSVIGHEIVWVFARQGLSSLAGMRGRRIAASTAQSSSRLAAVLLLRHAGLRPEDVIFTSETGQAAIDAIGSGAVDAVIHVAGGESQTAAALARLPGVSLLGIERAGLLAASEPRLRSLVMPQGSIELRSNLPPADLPTIVTLTHLLVRQNLHPALQRALLDVAGELHVMSGFLEDQGAYPTVVGSNYPVSPVAQAMAHGHRPWLERVLPFGLAQGAALVLYAIIPLGLFGMWLAFRAPGILDWRADAKLQHHYGELKFLEDELVRNEVHSPDQVQRLAARLYQLERDVTRIELPDRYADRWYTLREHLQSVRQRLHALHSE
ncbi:MAG: ABC transporter substrate-binding protein [Burkholderiaceae bacterium]